MADFIFVYIPCQSREQAISIGTMLVMEKVAACANILPDMTSIYKWEGKLEQATECVLIAKTRKSLFKTLQVRVEKAHSYDTPCIVSFDIAEGNADFLEWINAQTSI